MDFVPVVALASIVLTLMNFLKASTNRDVNGVVTQLVAWFAGILVVALFAHTDFAAAIPVGPYTLDNLNGASQLVVGLTVASTAGLLTKGIKAIDQSDSARDPNLIPGSEVHDVLP